MTYNPLIHNRHSIRLQGFDYSSEGTYFLTICKYQRQMLFGNIMDGQMNLNQLGIIVRDEWEKSAIIRAEIELGEFVIMPNHMHAIVIIRRGVRPNAPTRPNDYSIYDETNDQTICSGLRSKTIGSLISGFKSTVTKQINLIRNTPGEPVWQRNYWDHIIRNDESNDRIFEYINTNPIMWEQDQLFTP
jgi:putative transposase